MQNETTDFRKEFSINKFSRTTIAILTISNDAKVMQPLLLAIVTK
jgi:hypothetical protein